MVPPLKRALFAQDFMEDDPIRPVYDKDNKRARRDLLRTPPVSPLARFNQVEIVNDGPRRVHSRSGSISNSDSEPESPKPPMPTLPSRWDPCPMIPDGLTSKRNYIRNLKTDQALEEITCSFNAGRLVYMQHVRFAIGGTNKFPPEWQDSPKAIQSTWGAHTVTPENPGIPEWAALSTPNALVYRFESKVVTLEYAVGRIARLACSSWNASSANELLRWAEQIIPGAKRIEHPFLPPIGGSSTGRYALPELDEDSDAEFDRRRLNEDSDTVSNPSDAE